jgi:hypothetical protein
MIFIPTVATRFYSMVADKTTLRHSLPGIVVDATMALLLLSGLIL